MCRSTVLLCSLLLASPAAAAPGPIVPLAADTGELRVLACADEVSEAGPLPLTVPFNFSVGGCAVSGTAELLIQDGVLQILLDGVMLGVGNGVQVIGELDDLSFTGPELGEATTPVFTTLTDTLRKGDDVSLLSRSFSSSARYASTLLGGEIAASFGSSELSGPHFFIPNDAILFVPATAGDPAATIEAAWGGSLFNPSGFEASVSLEAFLPPSAAPIAPALSAAGRLALGIGLLGLAGWFASRGRARSPSEGR